MRHIIVEPGEMITLEPGERGVTVTIRMAKPPEFPEFNMRRYFAVAFAKHKRRREAWKDPWPGRRR